MKRPAIVAVLLGALTSSVGTAARGQVTAENGKRLYDANCAVCHGPKGKGDGPYRAYLTVDPADLTELSKKHGGAFPAGRVYEVIDGRWEVGAHGPREMPIWGYGYRFRPEEKGLESPSEIESIVRTRILSLIEYISRLQVR